MSVVGIRELRARLSKYLQRAKAGETIVITEEMVGSVALTLVEMASALAKKRR